MTRVLKSNLGVESLALADEIDPPELEEDDFDESDEPAGLNMDSLPEGFKMVPADEMEDLDM